MKEVDINIFRSTISTLSIYSLGAIIITVHVRTVRDKSSSNLFDTANVISAGTHHLN